MVESTVTTRAFQCANDAIFPGSAADRGMRFAFDRGSPQDLQVSRSVHIPEPTFEDVAIMVEVTKDIL